MMKAREVEQDIDRPLIEAIQEQDGYAMTEFIGRHERWVRGVIYSALGRFDEVDDVAQRVWMQVWNKAGSLEDTGNWRTWLYRIARNAATDAGRSKQRRRRLFDNLLKRVPIDLDHATTPDQKLADNERHGRVLEAISSLPRLYREPFVLKHLEDWSYRQIGEALGLPVDTVETRLVRARRLLRRRLAGKV